MQGVFVQRLGNKVLGLLCLAALFVGCNQEAGQQASINEPKTVVYFNGDIITVDPNQVEAEAVAVKNARIFKVGSTESVLAEVGNNVILQDLHGQTLLPGFIDAHGHISFTSNVLASVNLSSPPVGEAKNIDDIIRLLKEGRERFPDAAWLTGWGYDDSLLAERRHPNREDLDQVSTDLPIMLIHVSGHLNACNSKCLELAGITADSIDPSGGVIRRFAGTTEPDGVLEESAGHVVRRVMPEATDEQRLHLLEQTQQYYASYGITTIQDGATNVKEAALLQRLDSEGKLYLDIVGYLFRQIPDFPFEALTGEGQHKEPRSGHYRYGGLKLMLDGSPQGKTAYLTRPYFHPPHGQPADYKGYPALPNEQVNTYVDEAFAKGIAVIAHANGDAAADQLIAAVKRANVKYGKADRRTVMIHAQTAREDQLDQMKEEGIVPSFFSAHTFYWGDWHRDSVFGIERASRISPLKTTADRNMPYTTHNDTPVVPPDMMRLLWANVNRITRSGKVLGEAQRVSPLEGLKSMTINAAYQNFEENDKGSIQVGKLADFVILNKNPLKVDPLTIKDIQVMETIKDGVSVYRNQ